MVTSRGAFLHTIGRCALLLHHAPPPAALLPVRCERFVGAAAPNFCATLRSHTTRPTSQSSLRSPSSRPASAPHPPHPPHPALPLLAHRTDAIAGHGGSARCYHRRRHRSRRPALRVDIRYTMSRCHPPHIILVRSARCCCYTTATVSTPPLPLLTHRCHRNRSALTRSLLLLPQRGLNQANLPERPSHDGLGGWSGSQPSRLAQSGRPQVPTGPQPSVALAV